MKQALEPKVVKVEEISDSNSVYSKTVIKRDSRELKKVKSYTLKESLSDLLANEALETNQTASKLLEEILMERYNIEYKYEKNHKNN